MRLTTTFAHRICPEGKSSTLFSRIQAIASFLPGGKAAGLKIALSDGKLTVEDSFALPTLPLGLGELDEFLHLGRTDRHVCPFERRSGISWSTIDVLNRRRVFQLPTQRVLSAALAWLFDRIAAHANEKTNRVRNVPPC